MAKRIFLSALALIVAAFAFFVILFLRLLNVGNAQASAQTVNVSAGQGVRAIAQQLATAKLIAHPWVFEMQVLLLGARQSFQTGSFVIPPQASTKKVVDVLTSTPAPEEVSVRVPEDATTAVIAEILDKAGVMSTAAFLQAATVTDSRTVDAGLRYPFFVGKPRAAALEGYLFPDTYRFYKKDTASRVLAKFLDNFDAKVATPLATQVQASGHTLFQILTMASIVDKEVRTDADRRIVAGIFWRRIQIGMPLQSDATVNYVTGKQALQPTNDDTSVESPYNTYKHAGLPPGPIGNPSFSAIRAAATPEASPYLYFLHAPDGTTIYSKTYDEHLANKAKYLK